MLRLHTCVMCASIKAIKRKLKARNIAKVCALLSEFGDALTPLDEIVYNFVKQLIKEKIMIVSNDIISIYNNGTTILYRFYYDHYHAVQQNYINIKEINYLKLIKL